MAGDFLPDQFRPPSHDRPHGYRRIPASLTKEPPEYGPDSLRIPAGVGLLTSGMMNTIPGTTTAGGRRAKITTRCRRVAESVQQQPRCILGRCVPGIIRKGCAGVVIGLCLHNTRRCTIIFRPVLH